MSHTVLSGLKILLECLARAAFLAQPDDVLTFLSRHAEEMVNSGHEAYCHEEQWEKNFFLEESKRTSTAQTLAHLRPACPQNALRPALYPREERPRTRRAFSGGFPIQQKSEDLKAEEIAALDLPTPVPPPRPPRREDVQSGPSPVRTPSQTRTKSTSSSAWPLVAPLPQKQKAPSKLKRPCSRTITCRLSDCPHHKAKERSEVLKVEEPVAIRTRPARKVDMALQYRPKGGYVMDPELMAKRTTKSNLLPYRQRIAVCKGNVVPADTKSKDVNTCLTPGHRHMCVKQGNIPPEPSLSPSDEQTLRLPPI
ncbi:uncharacterized protein LOC118301497 [Scophthalmus maximus]|uniref:uncharacterized protein LOC118301497 n=1 Tax=Scophthalmus maximus TaxID=52904 RepID=UPI001FA91567|nr:uncharacterized protein LOC118301497 [Scophthalmus maximus]